MKYLWYGEVDKKRTKEEDESSGISLYIVIYREYIGLVRFDEQGIFKWILS